MIYTKITSIVKWTPITIVAFFTLFQSLSYASEDGFYRPSGEFLDSMITLESQTIYYVCDYDRVVEDHYLEKPRVHFLAPETKPRKGLKVRIKNTTLTAVNSIFPTIEIRYDSKKFGSKRFELKAEPPYSKTQLAVYLELTNSLKNKFEFEIYEARNNKILQKGKFSTEVKEHPIPSATILDDPMYCG